VSQSKCPNHDMNTIFKTIAEEAFMGTFVFNVDDGLCTYANQLGLELIEIGRESLDALRLEQLYPDRTNRNARALNGQLVTNAGFYQDVYVKKKTGMMFIANMGVKFFKQDDVDKMLIMFQDITVQKKLQRDLVTKQSEIQSAYEELIQQNEQLKELDKAKDRFLALTTHELRTPLSAIIASSEVLVDGMYDDEEQLKEFIAIIHEQGLHLSELINDILDFTKIQAGKMDFFVEQSPIGDFVERLVKNLENMAESYQVTMNLKPCDLFECYFDELRLKQILNNIINNACKYNKPGGSVEIWIEEDEKFGTIYVKDSGQGIPQDKQGDVFNEFETLGKVATHHEGTGLGMPISKRLIEAMGGEISFESEPGVGTTFWIKVPRDKVLDDLVYRHRDENPDFAA
jgi:signal transduction histidine kinase